MMLHNKSIYHKNFTLLYFISTFIIFYNFCHLNAKLKQDAYKTLKIPKTATQNEIQKAYRNLARELHPDKNPNKKEEFQEVANAYELIKDAESREKYDKYGEDGPPTSNGFQQNGPFGGGMSGGGFPFDGFHSFSFGGSDGFEFPFGGDFFGRNQRPRTRRKPPPKPLLYENTKVIELSDSSEKSLNNFIEDTTSFGLINFYSAGCSHCVKMKNQYIELSQMLEGAVRVAAFDCARMGDTCSKHRVHSYPHIVLYQGPAYTVYTQNKYTAYDLKKWIESITTVTSTKLTSNNWKNWIDEDEKLLVLYFTKDKNIGLSVKASFEKYKSKIILGVIYNTEKQLMKRFPNVDTFPTVLHLKDPDTLQGELLCVGTCSAEQLSLKFSRIVNQKRGASNRYGSHAPYKELTMRRLNNGDCAPNDSQFCFILVKYRYSSNESVDAHLKQLADKYKGDPAKFVWVDGRTQVKFADAFNGPPSCKSTSTKSCFQFVAYRPKRKLFEIMNDGFEYEQLDRFIEGVMSGTKRLSNKLKSTLSLIATKENKQFTADEF